MQKRNVVFQVTTVSCLTALGPPVARSPSIKIFLPLLKQTVSTFDSHMIQIVEGICGFMERVTKN